MYAYAPERVLSTLVALTAIAMMIVPFVLGDAEAGAPGTTFDDAPLLGPPGTGLLPASKAPVTTVDGDLVIDEDTHLENGTWVVNGNVEVGSANLTLDHVHLTLQNMSPRASVFFEVEPGGSLVCRNSTVVGESLSVYMQLEGSIVVANSSFIAEVQGGGQGWLNSIGGDLRFEDATLRSINIMSYSNVSLERCELWNYSKAVHVFYGWPIPGVTYTVEIVDCVFHDSGGADEGIALAGPGQLNVICNVMVRNCTFDSLAKAISALNFCQKGNVTIEKNTIVDAVTGIDLMAVGPMVCLRNNTISGTYGIVLVNKERWEPVIRDETVSATQYGLRLTAPMLDWTISGLDVEANVLVSWEGSHLTLANSSLDPSGTLHVTNGTMTLVNCTHGYKGQVVGGGSWIREHVDATFNASRWACGPAIVEGHLDITDANGTVLASKPHSVASELEVLCWQVTPDGVTHFRSARGSFWLEGWEFRTAPFDVVEGAFVDLEFVDDFVPNVTIESPTEGDLVQGAVVDLVGSSREVGTGVVSVTARLDDGPWVEVTLGEDGEWNVTLAVTEDGAHVLTVAVGDLAGNVGTASVEITTDDSGPFIEVLGPEPWVNDPDVELVARTEPGCLAFVNDVAVDVLGDGTFRRSIHLSGGVEAVRIRAVDMAGNWRNMTYSIELDQAPPMVVIDEPADGGWSDVTEVHVCGLVEEGATILVNGMEPERDGATWWIDLTFEEGHMDISAVAEDRAGNVGTVEMSVHIDLTAPGLQVTHPDDGSLLDAASVNVTGFVTDLAPVTVSVNGQAATVEGHDWYCLVELSEGENALNVAARDAAGNERVRELAVVRDTTAPTVEALLRVGEEDHAPGVSLLLNITGVKLVVEVDEPSVLTMAGIGSHDLSIGANLIGLDLDANAWNVLELSVVDLVGNAAPPLSFNVTTDLVAPDIHVLEPSVDEVLRQAVVLLKGTTELDADLTIEGKSCPVSAGGTFTAELELVEGTNRIVIAARDAAGNVATLTLDLTYEPEEPEDDGDDGNGWSNAVLAAVLVALVAAGIVAWRLRTRGA